MSKATDKIPDWVASEIQSAKFGKAKVLNRVGYILELYGKDGKADMQLYEPIEDGRHIVTMDLPAEINVDELEKGIVYSFVFEQFKAPLSEKATDYLRNEKGVEMGAIYRFGLRSLESLDTDADK